MNKNKLKTGDLVKVIAGKFRGTVDYISRFCPQEQIVYLKKVSRKKYDKSPEAKKKSQLKEIMVPIHISNVVYWLESKKTATKIGFQEVESKKVRKSRKYNTIIN